MLLRSIHTARRERYRNIDARILGGLLHGSRTAEHDQVGHRHLLVACLGVIESALNAFEQTENLGKLFRFVDFPVLSRVQADTGAIRTAPLVGAAERGSCAPCRRDQFGHRQARRQDLLFEISNVTGVHQFMVNCRNWVLPEQFFAWNFLTKVPNGWPHIAMGQLVPGAGERVCKLIRIFVEPARDLLVFRIHPHGHVGRGHDGDLLLGRIVSLWRHVRLVYILWLPLERASGALHKFPLIAEQHIKIAIVPFDRVWRPCAFDAAGDRVIAMANTELALPPKPLFGDVAAFRLCTNHRRVTRTVALAKCVTASSQRNSFFVVHGHPGKCFTDVLCRSQRIRIAVRAFGVHVDEAHLNGCERVLEHTLAAIAAAGLIAGGQPLFFRAPIDIFLRLENVFAAAAKPKRFTAHGFNGAIARKDHEIGPGNLVAVLLLDRP